MPVFNDIMDASEDARVLASYENSYYKGEAALIEHSVGGGRVLHLGSAFSRKNVTQLLKYTEVIEPFAAWIEAPNTVEVVMRKKDGKTFLFVLNFQSFAVSVTLKQEMKLLYTGESVMGDVILPAYGTAVYEVI